MKNLKRLILHIFFPNRCPVCGEFIGANAEFCTACPEKFTIYQGNFFIEGADGYFAAFEYNETISPAIMLLKDGTCGNASYALGASLARILKRNDISGNIDVIIPVPMHIKNKLARGYNQAELIAREISAVLDVQLCPKAVIKTIRTKQQKKLTAKERSTNLKRAFSVKDSELIRGKSVLIIDDVCTTGSTFTELTKLLKSAGAARVYCASCCKTPAIHEKQQNIEV